MATESVRVLNKGGEDFKGQYDRDTYVIPAGSESIVPWDATCLWLGDPRATDNGVQKNRLEEYRRLTSKFGVYDEQDQFDDARPRLEVYRLNGNRVTMLAEDPFGAPVDVFGSGGGEVDLATQVSKLQAMVNDLQARSDGGSLPDVSDVDSDAETGVGPDEDEDGNELPTDSASNISTTAPANASDSNPTGFSPPEGFAFPGSV